MNQFLSDLFAVKNQSQLNNVKKASQICSHFMQKLIESVEEVVDENKKKSHLQISQEIENLLQNQSEMKKIEQKFDISQDFVDMAFSPILQSGGQYNLDPRAESNNNNLSFDCIICSLGTKYKEFNANIVRTLFINSDDSQKQNYLVLLGTQMTIINNLKPGVKLKDVYEKGMQYLQEKAPDIVQNIIPHFGYGMGLEFKDNFYTINEKSDKIVQADNVFNVQVAAQNFKNQKGQAYSIMLADNVCVKNQQSEVYTQISKQFNDISYDLDLSENEEVEEENIQSQKAERQQSNIHEFNVDNYGRGKRVTRQSQLQSNDSQREQKRKQHQQMLILQKQQELEGRLKEGKFYQDEKQSQIIYLQKIRAYKNNLPSDIKKNQIFVDTRADTVILPINGQFVPFHISVIKNVSKHDEANFCTLRFNFHIPGSLSMQSNLKFPDLNDMERIFFVHELSFKSQRFLLKVVELTETHRKIKEIQKKLKDKTKIMTEGGLKEQDSLIIIKGKRPALEDLKIRPHQTGRKVNGVLECHQNGFRFKTNKYEIVDILFNNIKHAFFQPCDGEMIVIIHFNLVNPIMIGKKPSNDIQFYTEAGIQTEDLDQRRRNYNDLDEIEQERREKAQRKRLNNEFETFVKHCQHMSGQQVQFDVPDRRLGFYGTPNKSSVFLVPTSDCLVNLTEMPFFVMEMDEVEIVHFERVQFGLKNFDVNFVFKNYNKVPIRIGAVPTNYLEDIKYWVDSLDLIYSEGIQNLNWATVFKTIKEDIKKFVEDGGWNFLQDEPEDEQEDQLPEGDSVFTIDEEEEDDEEEESEFSDEDEDESQYQEDEDSEEYSAEEGEDESGMSWDEMDKKAEEEDRKNALRRQQLAQQKIQTKPAQQRRK